MEKRSCKNCKYFLEIPKRISLGDLKQEYLRFCVISGFHEPIDDTWENEHYICFTKKENEQ